MSTMRAQLGIILINKNNLNLIVDNNNLKNTHHLIKISKWVLQNKNLELLKLRMIYIRVLSINHLNNTLNINTMI